MSPFGGIPFHKARGALAAPRALWKGQNTAATLRFGIEPGAAQ